MNTQIVKKMAMMAVLSSALVGCGTFNGYDNGLSGITITSFNPMTPLGNLYTSSNSGYWNGIRRNFSLKHYTNRPEVQAQINWLQAHPAYLYQVLYHSAPFLYFVSQQVQLRHMPGEFALIPIIESSYSARTNRSSGADGFWQLMPRTAQGLGIKNSSWYDGRRDIFASTDAALEYFNYLHTFFNGDWLLAIAAYNAGEGSVRNRMMVNYREGKPTDFWDLNLPKETEAYVPRLLALAAIIQDPKRYNMVLPNVKNGPYFADIELRHQITLADAAELADMPLSSLEKLNPEYSHGATSPYGPYRLLLPIGNVELFKQNFANYKFPATRSWLGHWTHRHHPSASTHATSAPAAYTNVVKHRVNHGETLSSIAKHYGVSASLLEHMNHLHSTRLKPGQIIVIRQQVLHHPMHSVLTHSESRKLKHNKHGTKTTLESRVYHVKAGDTISHIAKKFGVSVRALKAHNALASERLHVGQKLSIPSR